MSFQCQHPKPCIWYQESEKSDTPKKPYCLLHDIEINFYNITKIQNCEDHKTYQKLKDSWNEYFKNIKT